MKKEVLETLQYLINDREIVGEELQLTNEAFLSLTTKEKIEIQEDLTKYIKEYIRVTSIFNMANNYDLNTEPSITTSEILQDLLNAASDYIENEDLEYNLISILRMSIMDSVEEEINLIEEFQKQGKKELTGIINFKLISALGRLEILRSMLLTEQKQEDYAIELQEAYEAYQYQTLSSTELATVSNLNVVREAYLEAMAELNDLSMTRANFLEGYGLRQLETPDTILTDQEKDNLRRLESSVSWQEQETRLRKVNLEETSGEISSSEAREQRGNILVKQLGIEIEYYKTNKSKEG